MHTGIGPFDIQRGARWATARSTYTKNAFKLQAFMNMLDGDATNLVSVDPTGTPIGLTFNTKTFDVELGDTRSRRRQARADLRRQPAVQPVQSDDRARARTRAPKAAPTSRTSSCVSTKFAARRRRARGQVQLDRQRRVLAAPRRGVQAEAGSVGSRELQPRVPRAVDGQQQPRHHVAHAAAARPDQSGVRQRDLPACRRRPSAIRT